MLENNSLILKSVLEKKSVWPYKDMKVGFQSMPYNTTKLSVKQKYYACVKMLVLQASKRLLVWSPIEHQNLWNHLHTKNNQCAKYEPLIYLKMLVIQAI